MGRAAIQLALRAAGVGGDLSIALAADLDGSFEPGGSSDDEGGNGHNVPRCMEPSGRPADGLEEPWELSFLVADADVCGGFGDLCGRRVA